MAYDEMSNYSGEYGAGPVDPYEAERLAAEEERKRREAEAQQAAIANPGAGVEMPAGLQPSGAETFPVSEGGPVEPKALGDTVAQKHEITTYADGRQTRKTTQEVPPSVTQESLDEMQRKGLKGPSGPIPTGPGMSPVERAAAIARESATGLTRPVFGQPSVQAPFNTPPSVTQESLDEMQRKGLKGPSGPIPTGPGTPLTAADIARVSGLPSTSLPRASTAGTLPTQAQPPAATGDQTYDRQLIAESGGNHIDPKTNQIITSPKGALGIAQIMPKSAMQPGYNIKDIFTLAKERGVPFADRSEASAKQLLANRDLNLEMGKNFRAGMLNYFGGDNEKATASYNAGAGRVNQAIKQADANGGDWRDYLPTETKDYLQKTIPPVTPSRGQPAQALPVAPPAEAQPFMGGQPGYDEAGTKIQPNGMPGQAQPAPVAQPFMGGQPGYDEAGTKIQPNGMPGGAQPAPVAQPFMGGQPGYDEAGTKIQPNGMPGGAQPAEAQPALVDPNAYTGQGLRLQGVTPPPPGQATASTAIDRYQAAQNDPMELMKMRNDESLPQAFRDRAGNRAADILQQGKTEQQVQDKVKEQLETGDMKGIAKDLARKPMTQFDMLWQSTMMRLMGAHKQADKLYDQAMGTGDKTKVGVDANGNSAAIDFDSQGKPTGGITADGKKLTATQAIPYAANIAGATLNKTLQTQANHSAATAMDAMRKENTAAQNKGLPKPYSEDQIVQAGKVAYSQTMSMRPGTVAAPTGGAGTVAAPTTGTTATPTGGTGATATPTGGTGATAEPVYKTVSGKPSVLENWKDKRVGEDVKIWSKRLEIQPDEIENTAQALAAGKMAPKELSGRQNDFRRLAVERALEINSEYSPRFYDRVKDVEKNFTSGKDHTTLVNTGTAVNHLMQFKDIAASTPGNTDVSSWNTFYQNLNKYGNAPEIKSKEQMAGFVAGELVKAATGAQGSMSERIHQQELLMKANTPAEVQMFIDNAIKLAHGRYSSMRASFVASTKQSPKDFDNLVGMPDEAQKAFAKIDATNAIKNQGNAAEKWARANPDDPRAKDILKRLGKQ